MHEFHFFIAILKGISPFNKKLTLRHEATWGNPQASIIPETEEELYATFHTKFMSITSSPALPKDGIHV